MSAVLAILILITVVVVGAIIWTKFGHDAVGRRTRARKQATGLQGQVGEWLYWDADLLRPELARYEADAQVKGQPTNPADRTVYAAVLRASLRHSLDLHQAYERVVKETKDPVAQSILDGHLRRAVRLHWRTRFTGPPALFWPWYYLVASVRYGRRHLVLETLTATLQEWRNA